MGAFVLRLHTEQHLASFLFVKYLLKTCEKMADTVETTPTTTVEETTPAVEKTEEEAAPATNGEAAEATPAATNGDAEKPAETNGTEEKEATKDEAEKEESSEAEEKKEEETPAANGDAKEPEAVKRKADETESDATTEKIAKLKEVAAEKVAEAMPSEPANEEEAKKPEEVAA